MKDNKNTPPQLARRRFALLALGGAAAATLAACGGGSGSDGDIDLLAIYNRLEDGMTFDEVTALVGRPADDLDSERPDRFQGWTEGGQSLNVVFNFGDGDVITSAKWDQISPPKSLSRVFEEN